MSDLTLGNALVSTYAPLLVAALAAGVLLGLLVSSARIAFRPLSSERG